MFIEEILVELLGEGSPTYRPVKAQKINESLYKILNVDLYDRDIETWRFEPGQIVEVGEQILKEYTRFGEAAKKFKVAIRTRQDAEKENDT